MVTLQSVSALPNQAPSGLLQNVGPGLILSLAIPNPPASFQTAAAGRVVAHDTATPAPIQFTFDPTLSTGAEFPDAGGIAYISSPGSMAPTAMGAGLLGGSGAAIVAAPPTYLDEASSIAVGLASLLPSAQAPIVVGPMHLTPPVPTLGQAAQWNTVPTFTCPTGHVLVLVHGVLSEVQGAFSNSTAENTREAGGYDDTEGFNYDFMGSVADNGNTLSEYLSQLAACPAVTSIGVEGHSYGGLVAGQAICDAPDPGGKINHLVTLATMWNGTPAATAVGAALSGLAAYQNAPMLFIANYPAIPGLALGIPAAASLQNASVITDMQPGSDAINRVQKCIQAKEQAGTLKAYTACGTAAQYSSIVEAGLDMGVSPDDGLVPVSSCNALPGSTPLGEFAVSHTKIEVSTAVQAAVGSAVRQFNSQYNLTVTTSQGTGSGTVSPPSPPGTPCGTNCWSYAYGAAVTLTANPAGNSVTKWSADGCSGNTCVVTMNSSLSVAVMFNLPYTYTGNYQTTTRISAIIGSGCTPSPLVTIGVGSQAATLLSTPLESPGTFSGTLTLAEGTITTTTPPMTCTTDGITTDVPGSTTPADVPGGTEAFSGTSDGHVISVSQATQAAICAGAATCSVSGTVSVLGENVYVTLNVVVSYPATGGVTTTGTMTLDLTEK